MCRVPRAQLVVNAGNDVYAVCMRDGKILAGGLDGKVRMLDPMHGRCMWTLAGHKVRRIRDRCRHVERVGSPAPTALAWFRWIATLRCALAGFGDVLGHGREPHLQRLHGPHCARYGHRTREPLERVLPPPPAPNTRRRARALPCDGRSHTRSMRRTVCGRHQCGIGRRVRPWVCSPTAAVCSHSTRTRGGWRPDLATSCAILPVRSGRGIRGHGHFAALAASRLTPPQFFAPPLSDGAGRDGFFFNQSGTVKAFGCKRRCKGRAPRLRACVWTTTASSRAPMTATLPCGTLPASMRPTFSGCVLFFGAGRPDALDASHLAWGPRVGGPCGRRIAVGRTSPPWRIARRRAAAHQLAEQPANPLIRAAVGQVGPPFCKGAARLSLGFEQILSSVPRSVCRQTFP